MVLSPRSFGHPRELFFPYPTSEKPERGLRTRPARYRIVYIIHSLSTQVVLK